MTMNLDNPSPRLTLGYELDSWKQYREKMPITIDLSPKTNSHILLCGMSGSGKSYLEQQILCKLILAEPEGEIYFADYKQDDSFAYLRGCPRYYGYKEALEKIAANDPRHAVTLEWSAEDVLDVAASYLRPGTPYMFMPWPRDPNQFANQQFRVEDAGGNVIGVTSLRTYTLYQRKHISLCCINSAFAAPGSEVYVIWGDRDKYPIKKIKATVNKFPSLDLTRNEAYQVEDIPAGNK